MYGTDVFMTVQLASHVIQYLETYPYFGVSLHIDSSVTSSTRNNAVLFNGRRRQTTNFGLILDVVQTELRN